MNISIVGQNAEHSLKKHLLNKSNPHGITIDTIGAAKAEHNHTSNQLLMEDGTDLLQFFSNEIGSIFSSSKTYTDEKIAALVNSAPETLDTLGELATALNENKNVTDVLNAAITNKADKEHTHTKLDNGYVLEWYGDRLLRSTDRPNTSLHFGTDVLCRYHSPSGTYYGIYDEGHKPTPTEIGAATLGGHNEYFFGIHLGTTQDALPYIYSENENINFRYKDSKSGAMQYTSVNDIMYSIGSKASSDHSHTTIKDSGDGRNITFNYSADGLSSASWLAAWNGSELRGISPSSVRTTIGAAAASHSHSTLSNSDSTIYVQPYEGVTLVTVSKNGIPTFALQQSNVGSSNFIVHTYKSDGSWQQANTLWGNQNLQFSLSGSTLYITTA